MGISGFTVRPPRARREKPRVSAFTSAKIDRILELKPDFVIGFSDIQADIAQALIKRGVEVWISNHRSVDGILGYVRRLGALVGAAEQAERYALELEAHIESVRQAAAAVAAPSAGLFRGMGRAAHHRHSLGQRADRHCRRRRCVPGARALRLGQGPHSRRRRRGRPPRPGDHFRLLVRQALSAESGGCPRAAGMRCLRCATANCTRSNRPSFFSRVRRR